MLTIIIIKVIILMKLIDNLNLKRMITKTITPSGRMITINYWIIFITLALLSTIYAYFIGIPYVINTDTGFSYLVGVVVPILAIGGSAYSILLMGGEVISVEISSLNWDVVKGVGIFVAFAFCCAISVLTLMGVTFLFS